MYITGTVHASVALGTRIKQSILDYCRSHQDKQIETLFMNIKLCSSPTENDVQPLVNLTVPRGLGLSAVNLKEHILSDEKVKQQCDMSVIVSIVHGDIA